jgi:hypothetical protein
MRRLIETLGVDQGRIARDAVTIEDYVRLRTTEPATEPEEGD